MKKALVTLLVFFCCGAAFSATGIVLTPKLGIHPGIYETFVAGGARADWLLGDVIGVGADAETAIGLAYGDAYENLLVTLDLWVFYLGAGVSLRLSPAAQDWPLVLPTGSAGLMIKTVQLGPGRLSLDLGMVFYVSAFQTPGSNSGNPLGDFFANAAQDAFGLLFSTVKLQAQIGYSIPL